MLQYKDGQRWAWKEDTDKTDKKGKKQDVSHKCEMGQDRLMDTDNHFENIILRGVSWQCTCKFGCFTCLFSGFSNLLESGYCSKMVDSSLVYLTVR